MFTKYSVSRIHIIIFAKDYKFINICIMKLTPYIIRYGKPVINDFTMHLIILSYFKYLSICFKMGVPFP